MRNYLLSLATDQKSGMVLGLVKSLCLWPLSLIYRLCVGMRNFLFDYYVLAQRKVKAPVISVGNITMGGVGKTPLVIYIAKALRRKRKHPAVLIRGFMPDKSSANSDEAQMLRDTLIGMPIVVGKERYKNAKKTLKKKKADVFVMDDGYQHRQLKRDLNIAVVDALNPWGNKQLIPRGVLREPVSALKRADIIILTKVDLASGNMDALKMEVNRINAKALVCETSHHPFAIHSVRSKEHLETSFLNGKNVCCLSSIGNPEGFYRTVKSLGATISRHFAFIDHHTYTKKDVEDIIKHCLEQHITYVVVTQKDLPKLLMFVPDFGLKINILVLAIEFVFLTGEDQFLERIDHILHN